VDHRRHPAAGRIKQSVLRLVPDHEGAESLWLLGLYGHISHDGQARAAPRPGQQVLNLVGWPLESCLNPAVGKVTHPSMHAMLQGHPPADGAEVDPLT
jgi:hypothetical protein